MIHDTQRDQISHKQNAPNIYVIMKKSALPAIITMTFF